MSKMELYWILKLDDFVGFFTVVGIVLSFIIFMSLVIYVMSRSMDGLGDEGKAVFDKLHKICIPICVVCLLLATVIPTTKQYLIMSGGEFLTNNEKVIMTGEKAFEMLDQYMDSVLKKGDVNE